MEHKDHPLKRYPGILAEFVDPPARFEGKWSDCVIPLRNGQRLHFLQDGSLEFFSMQLIPNPKSDEAPTVYTRSVGPMDGGVVAAFLATHCK